MQILATAKVSDLGAIDDVSVLQPQMTDAAGTQLTGSVSSTHNGPYVLQAKLVVARSEPILARVPEGSFVPLSESSWVTIATGPGGAHQAHAVWYWVRPGNLPAAKNAAPIVIEYRVIAK